MSDCGTCDGGLDSQNVRLFAEQLRRLVDDIQGVLLLEAALTKKMVFQEPYVRLGLVRLGEKLVVRRNVRCRC